jgi:hypothetical protein
MWYVAYILLLFLLCKFNDGTEELDMLASLWYRFVLEGKWDNLSMALVNMLLSSVVLWLSKRSSNRDTNITNFVIIIREHECRGS